jgi:methanogenic corrinoid protein MtbC1
MGSNLIHALADLKEDESLQITRERLENNEDPGDILKDARQGMSLVGERFARGVFFIPDLIYSGEILKEITDLVKPKMVKGQEDKKLGKIVLGTVAGDIHDIGLNIVEFMLDSSGFDVYNLGIDVPAAKFVEKVKETGAPILALSGFLTLAFDSMKFTVKAIETAGLRDQVKIMIGGGQIDDQINKYTGADAYGKDAMAAVALAKMWIGKEKAI